MTLRETHEGRTSLDALCTDIARLTGERASRCSEAVEVVALFFPHLSRETVAASLCACLRATDAESGALVRHFWQEVERLHFIQPLRAASNEGCMVHLVIDLTASDLDEAAARLETITEEVAQGSREGAGYCITGDIEPEGNAAFWEDEEEDNESARFDFGALLMQDEDDSSQLSDQITDVTPSCPSCAPEMDA